jgi:hypothetical protein
MQTMAATVIDVAREFQTRIASLPLAYAFFLYDRFRNTIVFTTFFDAIDHKAEDELAGIEGYMIDSFSEFMLEFRTIHLMGRDVEAFVPDGSVPLIARRGSFHRIAAHK